MYFGTLDGRVDAIVSKDTLVHLFLRSVLLTDSFTALMETWRLSRKDISLKKR